MVSNRPFGHSRAKHLNVVFPTPEQNVLLAQWASDRLGGTPIEGCQCLAVMGDGELKAVVKFFNYRWPNIEVGFVSEDWRWAVNRRGIFEVFMYPFKQLKCNRVTALIEGKNKRARKMVKRLGFVEEGKLRRAGQSGDVFLYGLLPEDLKIRVYHGQSISAAAA